MSQWSGQTRPLRDSVPEPRLRDIRPESIGTERWIGNASWHAKEASPTTGIARWELLTEPRRDAAQASTRLLATVELVSSKSIQNWIYTEDSVQLAHPDGLLEVHLPLTSNFLVVRRQPSGPIDSDVKVRVEVTEEGQAEGIRVGSELQTWGDALVETTMPPDSLIVISSLDQPGDRKSRVYESLRESRTAWNSYFESCPRADFNTTVGVAGRDSKAARAWLDPGREDAWDEVQLWCWWAVRANLVDSRDERGVFISPDRSYWQGSWSNDSAEMIAALTFTRETALARRLIVSFFNNHFTDDGDLGWYWHSTGHNCLGRQGDSGRRSHGVPLIFNALRCYLDNTGDFTILFEKLHHEITTWEMCIRYLARVFQVRDVDGDGLIEWRNLWETGWDNKAGPFFSLTPGTAAQQLEAWMDVVEKSDDKTVDAWYQAHSRPVAAIAEQVYLINACLSLVAIAAQIGDVETSSTGVDLVRMTSDAIEENCWSDRGYYADYDCHGGTTSDEFCLDGLYALSYVTQNPMRVQSVVETFLAPSHFGTPYPPSLSLSSPQFDRDGYWRGASWPREAGYVAEALKAADRRDLAAQVLLNAMSTIDGCVVPENVDPLTGRRSTPPTAMGYCVCIVLALDLPQTKTSWWPTKLLLKDANGN